MASAIIVFSINTGAYSAETIRGALESVPAGQLEAGYCVGMTYLQVTRRIVLPQALGTAFPPLSNELISLVKDTSLAANITVLEMLMATQRIVSRTYEALPLYLEVGVIYLIFSTALTWLQGWGETHLRGGMERGKTMAEVSTTTPILQFTGCARRLAMRRCFTASTWRLSAARSWPSSGPRDPARRPCCVAQTCSSTPMRASLRSMGPT